MSHGRDRCHARVRVGDNERVAFGFAIADMNGDDLMDIAVAGSNATNLIRHYTSLMETERQQPIVIPHRDLSAEALRGVLESFVLREGTDYGDREFSLDQKVAHVLRQLERGEAQIVFDAVLESIDILVSGR